MMQRTIGMYIANKVKDEIFRPDEVQDEETGEIHYVDQSNDPLDGELIRDNHGAVLGRAYRVPAMVYVVAESDADADAALDAALNDPDHETIIHWEGNNIGALVFVSSDAKNKAAKGPRGFRASDV